MYEFSIEVDVEPVKGSDYPVISYGLSNNDFTLQAINKPKTISFRDTLSFGLYTFSVEIVNKDPKDPDMAVKINSVRVMDIEDYQFIYNSMYEPDYPEWITDLPSTLKSYNYISWPGKWKINFTSPVYSWIHGQLNLGWIYE